MEAVNTNFSRSTNYEVDAPTTRSLARKTLDHASASVVFLKANFPTCFPQYPMHNIHTILLVVIFLL